MKNDQRGTGNLILACVIALLVLPTALQAEDTALPESVQRAIKRYKVNESGVSVYVREVDSAEPLVNFQADRSRNPASTIKTLTTWLALQELSPAWTWRTEVYVLGPVEDGVLQGDLLLKGYGDPYLITERYWWLQRQLRLRGIRQIEGDLVIDNSYFSIPPEDTSKFDGEGLRAYNVPPDALLVNFQAVHLEYQPDLENNKVQIIADPMPSNLDIDNRLRLVNGGCGGYQNGITVTAPDDELRDKLVVSGKFGRDCEWYAMSRMALTAPAFAYGVFRSLWEESGGTLKGDYRLGLAPEEEEPFFWAESPPLADVITFINKFSNNVMARHLFLTLGAEANEGPATMDNSRAAAVAALERRDLVFPELVLDNGAGLSRDTRISAEHLAELLLRAHSGPWQAEFVSSLSLAGLDGTVRKRFVDEAATGRMHLKTGRLRDVFTTAGYVHALSGKDYVVVILQNYRNADDGPGEEVQAALLRWVYQQ